MASDEAQADWLGGAHAEEAVTGFDATGWEASTGIAHAIHELPGVSVKSCGSEQRNCRTEDAQKCAYSGSGLTIHMNMGIAIHALALFGMCTYNYGYGCEGEQRSADD